MSFAVTAMTAVCLLLGQSKANAANVMPPGKGPSLVSPMVGEDGSLTIGGPTTIAPYLYAAAGGEVKGVVADLMTEVAKRLNGKVHFVNLSYAALIPAIQAGRVDAGVGTLIDTPAREQQLDFVDYMTTRMVLMGKPDNAKGIESLSDLCGRSASTPTGSSSEQMLKTQSTECVASGKKPVTVYVVPSAAEAQLQVQTGRADVFVQAYGVAVSIAKGVDGIRMVGKPFKTEYHGIGVGKQNKALTQALMATLQSMMADGTYRAILGRYGLSELAMDMPVLNGGTTLPPPSH